MAGLTEERLRVVAIIRALKAVGIRVKNWKHFLNGNSTCEQTQLQENVSPRFAFGRDLHLLPQHRVSDTSVPQFLVEACEFLSQHFHTEGLFRKTGSLNRIRTVRSDLEQGKPIFHPPHVALLQPCDVASLIKQFLRELPSPLIPTELQIPLIQAQGLEMAHDQDGARNRTTLLITALFPAPSVCTLRYICTFLSQVASRCSENRMDASSLAVVIAPNLLQCPTQHYKLNLDTEKHLDQQTAVIKSLILNANRIGVIPSCLLGATKSPEGTDTPSPAGGAMFSKRSGLSVYRSLRRQRRRSVGEIFVDAFSKLKPSRTGPPIFLDGTPITPLSKSPTPQSPITVKRKATEESLPDLEESARKRRSLHDLREDTTMPITHPEGSTLDKSLLEEKCTEEDSIPTTSKKKTKTREQRKSLKPPIKEEKVHRRKRSLRFFTGSISSNSNQVLVAPTHKVPASCAEEHQEQSISKKVLPSADASTTIPVILIDGPERVIIGNEVEDDPDLLNCSFAEITNDVVNVGSETCCFQVKDREVQDGDDECWTVLENESSDPSTECNVQQPVVQNEVAQISVALEVESKEKGKNLDEPSRKESKKAKHRARPRRSISLPEVTIEACTNTMHEGEKDVRVEQETINTDWFRNLPNEQPHVTLRKKQINKQDKMTDSTLGFKRPHQRLSMAERLRGFSALTLLLRTSKAAPQFLDKPQESLQRQGTRLKRQGARRFGRSISHEGVSERSPVEDDISSPPANQAYVGLSDVSPDSGVESVDQEPIILFTRQDVCNRSFKTQLRKQVELDSPFSPVNLNQDYVLSASDKTEPRFASKEMELELHKILDEKCHISGPKTDLDLPSPMFFQQMVPLNLFGDTSSVEDYGTDQASPLHERDKDATTWPNPSPPFEFPPFGSLTSSLTEDDRSSRCDLSPPSFQFKRSFTRRRYRDSPRWPSHDVRMSKWNPLPL